jgi:hypothetical protein
MHGLGLNAYQCESGEIAMIRGLLCVGIIFYANFVFAQETLPTITVTASTGESMSVPVFLIDGGVVPVRLNTDFASISDDPESTFSKTQICKAIKDNAPSGCNVNNFSPAPGIPSPTQGTWAPNGCGPGGWKNDLISALLAGLNPLSYSGDLNHPISNSPTSFEGACNNHDACYTSSNSKQTCDNNFWDGLTAVCTGNSTCNSFRDQYSLAVNVAGQGSYDADQEQLQCAQYGSNYAENQCTN